MHPVRPQKLLELPREARPETEKEWLVPEWVVQLQFDEWPKPPEQVLEQLP